MSYFKDRATQITIDILHGHGATIGAGGQTSNWEDCEYAWIHEMAAKRIVERMWAEGLLKGERFPEEKLETGKRPEGIITVIVDGNEVELEEAYNNMLEFGTYEEHYSQADLIAAARRVIKERENES